MRFHRSEFLARPGQSGAASRGSIAPESAGCMTCEARWPRDVRDLPAADPKNGKKARFGPAIFGILKNIYQF